MLVSICICTYNRCRILAHCLQSIARLTCPPSHKLEVIVIDNNSDDETSNLVEGLLDNFPWKIRYVFERQQGLSAARNRAVEEAKGQYIAFLDDECVVDPKWFCVAISDIEKFQPFFLGGPYVGAFLARDRPRWFKIEYGNAYFLTYRFQKGFHSQFRPSGGNMFVKREVFGALRFDNSFGMRGSRVGIREEIDLQERFRRDHISQDLFFYDPELLIRHFILPEKMTLTYRIKRVFAAGVVNGRSINLLKLLFELAKVACFLLVSPFRCIFRDRRKYPFWQNDAYERAIPQIFFHLGVLKGAVGRSFTVNDEQPPLMTKF
jgi:glycosyltransferase involved in cell wall biosynthesis